MTRRRKIAITLLALIAILFFFRHRLLTAIGNGLVRGDQAPPTADIMVIGGDGATPKMLAWLAAHDDAKLLLVDKPAPRVVQVGATVSDAQRRREISKAAGVPEARIEILVGTTMRQVRPVQAMQTWLSRHPQRRIHVLCDQFASRGLRRAIDRRVDPAVVGQVTLEPLVDRRYDVGDWWTTRLGIRAVFDSYLGLGRAVLGLGAPEPPSYLSPDQYEEAFLHSLNVPVPG